MGCLFLSVSRQLDFLPSEALLIPIIIWELHSPAGDLL